MSRNQSLIKKNIAPSDLRPSDILIERFVGWKTIVKQLIAYFEVWELRRVCAQVFLMHVVDLLLALCVPLGNCRY